MAQYQSVNSAGAGARGAAIDQGLRTHMNKVYGLMSVGMLLTGAAAWAISGLATTTDPSAAVAQIGNHTMLTQLGSALYLSPLKWLVMFAPLLMVFAFTGFINRMSVSTAQLFFYAYAALMGVSLSSIFIVFTGASIAQTFLVTSIAFAALSLYGYTTKRNLTGMGTFLMMGLVGLLVAMLVNFFLQSAGLSFAISAIGVLIFAGLTAYDTQSIKSEYVANAAQGNEDWLGKSAIMGALRLYLDFINMFMFLLQFMGNRN